MELRVVKLFGPQPAEELPLKALDEDVFKELTQLIVLHTHRFDVE